MEAGRLFPTWRNVYVRALPGQRVILSTFNVMIISVTHSLLFSKPKPLCQRKQLLLEP